MWADLMARLDQEAKDQLDDIMVTRTIATNKVLFFEGEPGDAVYVIERGHVLVERVTEQGDTVAVAVLGPDSIVGEQALLGDEPRGATARAVTPTTVRVLNRTPFTDLRRRHRAFDELLVGLLDGRIRELNDLVLEARHHPAENRIRRRLDELHDLFGREIPLTQSTIAALAGTTRPTTNSILRSFEEQGVLELGRGRVVLHRPDTIAER